MHPAGPRIRAAGSGAFAFPRQRSRPQSGSPREDALPGLVLTPGRPNPLVMERISLRSLHQDTAGVLARVEQGETVEITNRGRLVARIVPAGLDPLDELVNTGAIAPPTMTLPFTMPVVGQDAGELISGLLDGERW